MAESIALQLQPTAEVVPMNDFAYEFETGRFRRARLSRDHDLLIREHQPAEFESECGRHYEVVPRRESDAFVVRDGSQIGPLSTPGAQRECRNEPTPPRAAEHGSEPLRIVFGGTKRGASDDDRARFASVALKQLRDLLTTE